MQKVYLLMAMIPILFLGIEKIIAQPQVAGYSDLNDVYSLYLESDINRDTMWIGTSGGVVFRYSPFSTTTNYGTLTQQDNGLGSNFVTAIVVDDNGNKFFGTFEDGITVYNNGTVTIYNSASSPPINDNINCLAKDANGDIWAGTQNGAYRFTGSAWEIFNTTPGVHGEVRAIDVDNTNIWFGTCGNGLYRYDGANWINETTSSSVLTSNTYFIGSDTINALSVRNDSLLVGTPSGTSFFEPYLITWSSELVGGSNNPVFDVEFGEFYLFTLTSNGFYYADVSGGGWSQDFVYPFFPQGVTEMEGPRIWIGYGKYGNGVLPHTLFASAEPSYSITDTKYPNKNSINDIISHNDTTFFSTSGNGLMTFGGTEWGIKEIADFPNLTLYDMDLQVDTIRIAAGTDGIATYNPISGLNIFALPDNLAIATSIAVDRIDNKRIWCGTDKGVFSYYDNQEDNTRRFTQLGGQLMNDIVKKIAVDINGVVWFMHENGITRYDAGSGFSNITTSNLGLTASALLSDIAADLNGEIWITSNEGVVEYNSGIATVFTTADGLSNNIVTSVYVDSRNIKYFGTNTGITTMSQYGIRNITKTDGLLTEHIKAIAFDEGSRNIWSGGDWGGISSTNIPPLNVNATHSIPEPLACYGSNFDLNGIVSGGFGPDHYSFQWTSDDNSIDLTTQNVTITANNTTTYHFIATDGYSAGTADVAITVITVDSSLITGLDTICPNGEVVRYTATNTTGTTNSYNWNIVGGANSSDLSSSFVDVIWNGGQTTGNLYLTETDSYNCSITQQFDVHILTGILPDIILKNGGQILICRDSGYVYQWFKDNVAIPGATRQFYYLDQGLGSVNGSYYVEMDIGNNCMFASDVIAIDQVIKKAYPIPTASVLNIDFSSEKNSQGKTVIRTLSGTIIEEISFNKESEFKHLEINVSNYKPGTYFYSIILDSKQIESGKFVIN